MLFALAKELSSLYFLLPKFQSKVITFLTELCLKEETVIRDQAVSSLEIICAKMSPAEIQDQMVPIVYKFLDMETQFTSRIVGIKLLLSIYPQTQAEKPKLLEKFCNLTSDETPMVKRCLAHGLFSFTKVIDKEMMISRLIPLLKTLSNEDQDTVRVICY